jgi:tRNA(Ile)-lysidine synthase
LPTAKRAKKEGGEWDFDAFIVQKGGEFVPFDPNDEKNPVEGDLLIDTEVNGIRVKSVLQIYREAAGARKLAEWAEVDLAAVADGAALDIAAWRALSTARQGNVLRAWLQRSSGRVAPASLIERLRREVPARGSMRWPAGEGELRSYRGALRYEVRVPSDASAALATRSTTTGALLDLSRPGVHDLADWGGTIEVRGVATGGVPVALAARLTARARSPGDRFQAGAGRPPRSLKLQFQAAGVPAWERRGPVLCRDDRIVFVPGLGIDARARAVAGEPQVVFAWLPRR